MSPVVADAFHLLRTDLYEHLDEAESLTLDYEEWSEEDMDTARKLIIDLVTVVRGMLVEHQVQASGNCGTCASAWPCTMVGTIHGLVKDPERQFVALVLKAREDR